MSFSDSCFQESTTLRTFLRYSKMHLLWAREKTRPLWTMITEPIDGGVTFLNKHPLSDRATFFGVPGFLQYVGTGIILSSTYLLLRGMPISRTFKKYQNTHLEFEKKKYARELNLKLRDRVLPHTYVDRQTMKYNAAFISLVPVCAVILATYGIYKSIEEDAFGTSHKNHIRNAYMLGLKPDEYTEYCAKRDAEAIEKINAKFSF